MNLCAELINDAMLITNCNKNRKQQQPINYNYKKKYLNYFFNTSCQLFLLSFILLISYEFY